MVLTDELFNAVIARARQFYQLALIDCGPHIEHRVMRSVLPGRRPGDRRNRWASTARRRRDKLDWLDARNSHELLLRRSVVVLNDVHDNADSGVLAPWKEVAAGWGGEEHPLR